MTDHFIALPVGQGDAFFLQRRGFTALIDGGRSRHGFPGLFQEKLNRKSVDVVVCTHNDADHANGILGFLESGLNCREVWLPALWQSRLDDMLTKPREFLYELIGDVRRSTSDQFGEDGRVRLDRLGDHYASDEPAIAEERSPREPTPLCIEEGDDGNAEQFWLGIAPNRELARQFLDFECRYPCANTRLLHQALSAAERIRTIALACAHRGVPIRWFRHSNTSANGGKPEALAPLNATEIVYMRSEVGALQYLALTAANRTSLVFCSPPEDCYPGVVLSADSDLKFSTPILWQPNMIVTAPHHGSEANKAAYDRLATDRGEEFPVIWVRSDGNYRSRPGNSYKAQHRRFCTLCRSGHASKQVVRFALKGSGWAPVCCRACAC